MCCHVLQCVAVCCSVLQCVAVCFAVRGTGVLDVLAMREHVGCHLCVCVCVCM